MSKRVCHAAVLTTIDLDGSPMSLQNTNFSRFQRQLWQHFSQVGLGSWRRISVALIALLLGYVFGTLLPMYFMESYIRPLVVILMVVVIELLVFLRSRVVIEPWPLHWLALDNLRIGAVFAVVLEAFKLGS